MILSNEDNIKDEHDPLQCKRTGGDSPLAPRGVWYPGRHARVGVPGGRRDRAETHNAPAHQEPARLFERLGCAEIIDGRPHAREGTELKSIQP